MRFLWAYYLNVEIQQSVQFASQADQGLNTFECKMKCAEHAEALLLFYNTLSIFNPHTLCQR